MAPTTPRKIFTLQTDRNARRIRGARRRLETAAALTACVLTIAPLAAQKGKPAPSPQPVPLTITFGGGDETVKANADADHQSFSGYVDVDGVLEGAYINSLGGIELRLVPGPDPQDERQLLFHLVQVTPPPVAPPCALPSGGLVTATTANMRFNLQDARGNTIGVDALLEGDSATGGSRETSGYDIGAILQFAPDEVDPTSRPISNIAVIIGRQPAVTLRRDTLDQWTVTVSTDAASPLLMRCTVPGKNNRPATYDMGYYHFNFSLVAQR